MKHTNIYSNNNGKKCIVTHLREVFEDVDEPKKLNLYNGYDDGLDDDDEGDEYAICPPKKPKKKRLFEIDEVLGIGHGETFVEVCIPLCPPAVQILDCFSREDIKFDALIAKKDKVFINGRLLKCIPYRSKRQKCTPCCHDEFSILKNTENAVAQVPFMMCINVPGSVEKGKVVVLDYDVNAVNIPRYSPGCLIKSITEKDCIQVKVKVVKPKIVSLPT